MTRRLVDLTQPLSPETPVLPGDQPLTVTRRTTHDGHGYAILSLGLGTHAGTHLDAPFHMLPDGPHAGGHPGLAVRRAGRDPRRAPASRTRPSDGPTSWPPTGPRRAAATPPPTPAPTDSAGCRLCLLRTGWDSHFGDPDMVHHPYLTPDAADWLLESGVELVGTDAPSLDPVAGRAVPRARTAPGGGSGAGGESDEPGRHSALARSCCAFLPLPPEGRRRLALSAPSPGWSD